jgi:preprotein translocase subunit SecY
VSAIATLFRIPDLRNRLAFTLGMLAIYRLGIFVTTPGVDRAVMSQLMSTGGGILGLFNLFSGGALEQLSVFALGIMPYISASIIIQLLSIVVPTIERLQKEGEQGRRKLTQWTRYGTIALSLVQGTGIALYLENLNDQEPGLVTNPGFWFRAITVLSLTTGTAFLMWLGEQITERGIGNGISLIIFAGIVVGIPGGAITVGQQAVRGELSPISTVLLVGVVLAVVAVIVFFERAQRRIPVQYAKRATGRATSGTSQSSYLPLKINTSGVIPPIFASSILLFPSTVATYFPNSTFARSVEAALNPLDWRYNVIYVVLIVFFAFFYTAVTFNVVDVADNLKRNQSFVPGIRPGKKTAEYIDFVLTRVTFGGAIYLAAVCVLPVLVSGYFPVNFYYGGTSLLIVVSVGLETVNQIESHLITRQYETLTSGRPERIRDRISAAEVGS